MIGSRPIMRHAWGSRSTRASLPGSRASDSEVRGRARPGLLQVVTSAVRPTMIGTLVFIAGMAVILVWFVAFSRPGLAAARHGSQALSAGELAMTDEQDALRGYLASGDAAFLQADRTAEARAATAATATLKAFKNRDPQVSTAFAQAWTAAQAWEDKWADDVENGTWRAAADISGDGTVDTQEQAAFLAKDVTLFDRYRSAEAKVQQAARSSESSTMTAQTTALVAVAIAAMLLGIANATTLFLGRRRLHRLVVAPIESLSREADRVASGDQRPIATGGDVPVYEVAQLRTSLQGMTSSLVTDRAAATQRGDELLERTARLQQVLDFSRQLSASLSLTHVVTNLTRAMRQVAGADSVTVWLQNWDDRSLASFNPAHPESSETIEIGAGAVGRAAQYARTMPLAGSSAHAESTGAAIPLVIGGRVVGVVAAVPSAGNELDMEMVDALALQGAAAIQAARTHSEAQELSRRDPLTNLANRRQLTVDLAAELERAVRFGHPLSFVMIDMDHFKRLNDTYGHQRGDQVLREVADTITREIRAIDGAYRYGGEELALLLREASGADAVRTVERIRAGIATRFPWASQSPVTLSAGVAELDPAGLSAAALVSAADQALYAAKRAGRNRVRLHVVEQTGQRAG